MKLVAPPVMRLVQDYVHQHVVIAALLHAEPVQALVSVVAPVRAQVAPASVLIPAAVVVETCVYRVVQIHVIMVVAVDVLVSVLMTALLDVHPALLHVSLPALPLVEDVPLDVLLLVVIVAPVDVIQLVVIIVEELVLLLV